MSIHRAAFPVPSAPVRAASLPNAFGFERTTRYRLTCAALLILWIAWLYPQMKVIHDEQENLSQAAIATEEGSLANRLLVVSFAALGALYLPRAIRGLRMRRDARVLMWWFSVYLLWSGATILWSDDPALTFRRLGQLILLLVGMVGLGAGFYVQTRQRVLTFAKHVLFASMVAVLMLIVSRIADHSISELLNPAFSLKSSTNIQEYVYPVSYGIIAALVYPLTRRMQIMSVTLLSVMLLLLKGRALILSALAVGLLISALLSKRGLMRGLKFAGGVLLVGTQIDFATGARLFVSSVGFIVDSLSSLVPYLTVGRDIADLLTLDGRIPLWQELWPYVWDHPVIGHGFGAFWNPGRFDTIYSAVEWRAVVAHNGFLDELLGTGIIGLVLILGVWSVAMRLAIRAAKQDKRAGYFVFGCVLLLLCFNSTETMFQYFFQSPMLFSLMALFALLPQPAAYVIRKGPAQTFWRRE